DWSSDVCSSDLGSVPAAGRSAGLPGLRLGDAAVLPDPRGTAAAPAASLGRTARPRIDHGATAGDLLHRRVPAASARKLGGAAPPADRRAGSRVERLRAS